MLMSLMDIKTLLACSKTTLVAMRRDGRLPAPVEGVTPRRWDADTIRNAILAGTLATRRAGRPKGARGRRFSTGTLAGEQSPV
jgi:hypothetical protein